MTRLVAAAVLALVYAETVVADDGYSHLEMARYVFAKADADKDGVLTPKEHDKAGLGRYGVSLADFDLNGDDLVTWKEYKAIFNRYHGTPGGRSA